MTGKVDLRGKSIEVIESNQSPSGALVACPTFRNYNYCWLRDGTFTAYALDRAGRHRAAERFYRWVKDAISPQAGRVERLLSRARAGEPIAPNEYLHTRYNLDGSEGREGWPNFQLDGYGAWLWGLAEHVRMAGNRGLLGELRDAVDLTIRYLTPFWPRPNYDCWEEFGDRVHPSTLACIYGGLRAINRYLGDPGVSETAALIKSAVLQHGVNDGHLVKSFGSTAVDSNLLWACTPFRLLEPDHPIMRKTVSKIEETLLTGGLHRYREDTYYGGGEWLLLTAFLSWYYCETGRVGEAARLLDWIEARAGEDGLLPEQVPENLNRPEYYPIWLERWGEIARPLLWSHAMYLVLAEEIRAAEGGVPGG